MIRVTRTFKIPENEYEEHFIRGSGPGGQNINKVATAVQLRFNIDESTCLPSAVKKRLKKLALQYLNTEGVIILEAKQHRTQERNRKAAREKLAKLVRGALKPPIQRKKTFPSRTSIEKRLEKKNIRAKKKNLRKKPPQPPDW